MVQYWAQIPSAGRAHPLQDTRKRLAHFRHMPLTVPLEFDLKRESIREKRRFWNIHAALEPISALMLCQQRTALY